MDELMFEYSMQTDQGQRRDGKDAAFESFYEKPRITTGNKHLEVIYQGPVFTNQTLHFTNHPILNPGYN
jgi:hypothetical protein